MSKVRDRSCFSAWKEENENKEEDDENEETKIIPMTSFEIISEYAEYSTIQGLIYIFMGYQVQTTKQE